MKLSTFILSASLLLNTGLGGILALHSNDTVPSDVATPARTANASSASAGNEPSLAAIAGNAAPPETAIGTRLWDRLRADDLSTVVAHLRAAGFPPVVVRRVITQLVTEKFDARRLEIEKDSLTAPYWAQSQGGFADPKTGPQLRALMREQAETIKRALGLSIAGVFADTDEEKAMLRLQIGDIAPEKLDQLWSVAMDYGEKSAKIYSGASGGRTLLPEDRAALAALEKGFREEFSKFLTPAEATEFNVHASRASHLLRSTLGAFKPTEDEFRSILPVYQTFQEQFLGPAFNLPPDQENERKLAQDQMVAQVKGLLGPDRGAEFEQAIEPANSQLNRLVARLDLPMSAVAEVAALQKDTQQRAATIRSDTTLSSTDRKAQLNSLADEASGKVANALGGARGLEAYKMNGGQWLVYLRPGSPPQRTAPKG